MAEEQILLNENNVFVSTKRVTLNGKTFQLKTITSVRVKRGSDGKQSALLLLVLCGFCMFSAMATQGSQPADPNSQGSALGGMACLASIVGLVVAGVMAASSRQSELFFATAANEMPALKGRDDLVLRIEAAINQAMAAAE